MTTDADVIRSLGGAKGLAEKLTDLTGEPISQDRVRKWAVYKSGIPHWARPYIWILAKRVGIPLPEHLKDPGEKFESDAA